MGDRIMSTSDDVEINSSRVKIGLYGLLVLVATILALPRVQGVLYSTIFGNPSILQWGIVSLLITVVAIKRESFRLLVTAAVVFVLLGLIVGPIAGGAYAHTDMANQMQSDAKELETLPNSSKENVRVLPRSVSDNYAQSSMQYPQYKLSSSDITYRNGSYTWSYGLEPDNPMVALSGQQKGALYVDITGTEKQVNIEETTFSNGRGQYIFDSYRYQSVLSSPFKKHNWDTTFNAKANGKSYIAHSTTTYKWKFRMGPIPQFYATPQHGSVEVMSPSGEIESLSPEEAQESSLLQGQNFYPYDIAMFKVKSMQYVNGALNKWLWKEDVLQIANLPEDGNNWPIAVPTEGDSPGLTYFIATEPTGSGNGVYEIWTIDGQTGEAAVQQYNESQLGPQKAVDFTERRSEVNQLSNAKAIAPVPVVNGETLYWHVKVVAESNSGIIYTAFVNAESGDVTLIEGTEPIYAFLTQSEAEEIQNGTEADSSGGMSVNVVVTDEDGEIVGVENITVPKGGNFDVSVQDQSSNRSST
ncbi:hypothetical protein BDK88_2699 [Natrinema hispanicum]|uniref:Uncharacterized protein n=2 Tax=Natrinema hispanicum TaxID=392421 RepID=A0A482YB17_9EURY|nr:hypothetical protein BDK88_2699 [Natrinema hispanicum]